MRKKLCSLLVGVLLATVLSIPAFASNTCSCGGKMDKTVHRTPWLTVGYTDCTHGYVYAKDALLECTEVTTYVCQRCGKGFSTEVTRKDVKCLASKSLSVDMFDGETCSVCSANAVVTKTHHTSWLTVETDKDGNSSQERLLVKTTVCENCGTGTTTEETETRVTRLHG